MAKKKNYIDLSPSQKDEIRRLTQLANRRIKAAEKVYRQAGKDIIPREIAGQFQRKRDWQTASTPISRSIKFESRADYNRQLRFLRQFELSRPTISEFTEVQREKVMKAIETALGIAVPEKVVKRLDKMTAPQLSDYWNVFSDRASKMGVKYSSGDNMALQMAEFFPEDIQGLTESIR